MASSTTITNQTINTVKRVPTNYGETIQAFAVRTTGDATQWPLIVQMNDLVYPFLAETASDRVAAYGDSLVVPAQSGDSAVDSVTDTEVLLVDVAAADGSLGVSGGDLAIASGVENLNQALSHRLNTRPGSSLYHQDYGNRALALVGLTNDSSKLLLGMGFIKECLLSDSRVASVDSQSADISGDALYIYSQVNCINGKTTTTTAST